MNAVEIIDLIVKIDGFPVISRLNLLVDEGEEVGIMCENYPSTLIKVFYGFELPDSGEIWFYNLPPRQAFARNLVSPQMLSNIPSLQFNLQPHLIQMSIRENSSVNLKVNINDFINNFYRRKEE